MRLRLLPELYGEEGGKISNIEYRMANKEVNEI